MKANELRIGNYYLDFDNEIQQIETIEPFMFGFKYRWEWAKYIKPIPLTEEILLKCGIEKWINKTFEIRKNLDDTFTIYAWRSGKSIFICHLKYLHSLQNIYPFLTNEELNINL